MLNESYTPHEESHLMSVRHVGFAIKYIKNPSIKVQMESVTHHPYSIHYIDNPCEQVINKVRNNCLFK